MSFYRKLVRRSSLALLAAAGLVAVQPVFAAPVAFGGTVRDALGRAIAGAEVWFLPNPGSSPLARVTSDSEGRFHVSALADGRYRVGAAKTGYRLFVAEIDTLLARTLDVVLRPAGERAASVQAESADPAWVLRTPRRSLWRETRAGLAQDSDGRRAIDDRDLTVRIDQRFSAGPGEQLSTGPSEAEFRGADSRALVIAPVADEGVVRSRVERIAAGATDSTGGRLDMDRLSVDVTAVHALSAADDLEWQADFSDRRSEALGAQPSFLGEDHERVLSLGTQWTREAEPERELRVDLGWARAEVDSSAAIGSFEADQRAMLDRWCAGATFVRTGTDGHNPSLGLGVVGERVEPAGAPAGEGVRDEVRLELEAFDRVSTARGLGVEYGARWVHAGTTGPQVIEPRLGAGWSSEAMVVHAEVLWAHDLAPDGLPEHSPDGRLGYEASIALPLAEGWNVTAGTRLDPRTLDPGDTGRIDPSSLHPVYVAATGARERESLANVEGDLGWGRLWIEGRTLRANGEVIPLLPFAASGETELAEVRVASGRAGVAVASSGTGVELAWMRAESASPSESGASVHSTVDVRVTQALGGDQARLAWRLLLAYQHASSRSKLLDAWTNTGGAAATRNAFDHRLSAGVSVVY